MATSESLLQLFQAFRENNDGAFRRAAESIIADELAANHHALGRELQKALGTPRNGTGQNGNGLRPLPKEHFPEDDLLFSPRPPADPSRLILEAKASGWLNRVVDEHGSRLKLAEYGYRPKSKLLFWGPPGCGKTLAAHYLAQRLGLPIAILRISAAVSSYLGETAARVNRAFDAANRTPLVLFLDEVDAIAKDRDDANDVGELRRVVTSILQAMDTFREGRSVLVAASNHQYLLDAAVWRRFDSVVEFPLPSPAGRQEFLNRLLNGVRVEGSLAGAVKASHRLSFADIEKAVIEAVKTMILADRKELSSSNITEELSSLRHVLRRAKQTPMRPPRG